MVNNFSKITIKRIVTSKKFLGVLIYLLCIPILAFIMNEWSPYANSWNAVFFIFGNRYIYFLFIVPVFLILMYDIANEGNLRYCVGRLITKSNLIKSQIIVMLILSLFLTVYVFSVVLIESFLTLGLTLEWSQETKSGLDPYTMFSNTNEVTPIGAVSLFIIRFFTSLVFIGSLYIYWQGITKRQYSSIGVFIILLLLFSNAILNIYNIPILNVFDLSFLYTFAFNPEESTLLLYALTSQIPLVILCAGLIFFSLRLSKEVNF
jgi:hypothetical protein